MIFSWLIGPYMNYLYLKFHDDPCHRKGVVAIFIYAHTVIIAGVYKLHYEILYIMDPILDIHMLFTKLIGPYVNYLDFKFHDDTYHIKCAAVNFHICSHGDNSNCSGPNKSNTNRDTLIKISGVARNKM